MSVTTTLTVCCGVQPVGRMVLNKNLDNFFNENEQLAFSPGIVPPGIYYSNDKMLQCRIFAYGDTQRHRLGPNYLLLPANAPKCAHHNNHHEGFMNFTHRDEEVTCVHQSVPTLRFQALSVVMNVLAFI